MIYDKIASGAVRPIDRKAGMINEGYTYQPNMKSLNRFSHVPDKYLHCDLSGLEYGKFKVLGLNPKYKKSARGKSYVVRCSCGLYTNRRKLSINKGVREGELSDDCCDRCAQTKSIRRTQEYLATGKNTEKEETIETLTLKLSESKKKRDELSMHLRALRIKTEEMKEELRWLNSLVGDEVGE